MITVKNIFENLSVNSNEELTEEIFTNANFRVERIISNNSASPENFWYDQDSDEFVMLISGSAGISFDDGDAVELHPGDFITINRHRKHRVDWTDPEHKTTWLALHY